MSEGILYYPMRSISEETLQVSVATYRGFYDRSTCSKKQSYLLDPQEYF